MPLMTDYAFTLPKGYVDEEGHLQREGVMRLATAADEILPMKDPRVQQNPSYQTIITLSRVITRLGTVQDITPKIIEQLFTVDFTFLCDMYQQINSTEDIGIEVVCPKCGWIHKAPLNFAQET